MQNLQNAQQNAQNALQPDEFRNLRTIVNIIFVINMIIGVGAIIFIDRFISYLLQDNVTYKKLVESIYGSESQNSNADRSSTPEFPWIRLAYLAFAIYYLRQIVLKDWRAHATQEILQFRFGYQAPIQDISSTVYTSERVFKQMQVIQRCICMVDARIRFLEAMLGSVEARRLFQDSIIHSTVTMYVGDHSDNTVEQNVRRQLGPDAKYLSDLFLGQMNHMNALRYSLVNLLHGATDGLGLCVVLNHFMIETKKLHTNAHTITIDPLVEKINEEYLQAVRAAGHDKKKIELLKDKRMQRLESVEEHKRHMQAVLLSPDFFEKIYILLQKEVFGEVEDDFITQILSRIIERYNIDGETDMLVMPATYLPIYREIIIKNAEEKAKICARIMGRHTNAVARFPEFADVLSIDAAGIEELLKKNNVCKGSHKNQLDAVLEMCRNAFRYRRTLNLVDASDKTNLEQLLANLEQWTKARRQAEIDQARNSQKSKGMEPINTQAIDKLVEEIQKKNAELSRIRDELRRDQNQAEKAKVLDLQQKKKSAESQQEQNKRSVITVDIIGRHMNELKKFFAPETREYRYTDFLKLIRALTDGNFELMENGSSHKAIVFTNLTAVEFTIESANESELTRSASDPNHADTTMRRLPVSRKEATVKVGICKPHGNSAGWLRTNNLVLARAAVEKILPENWRHLRAIPKMSLR